MSFPAKTSKTSRPSEQLRKGFVNNIKPEKIILFFYEHTHCDTLSTGLIVSVPDGEELEV